ncbi:MAG TPA: sulfotransferase [Chloroflexota bacterium]|nr:sulfotransferase [Chloroflexota bacterium]
MSDQTESARPKIFGIGLERTGTTSLTNALNWLGFSTVHYPEDETTRTEIYRHFSSGSNLIRLSLLDHCDALTDTPVCCIYKALDLSYPGSRFILTVRDKESWLRSRRKFAERWIAPRFKALGQDHPANAYTRFIGDRLYGPYDYDPSRAFDAYYADAIAYFKDREDQFLLLNICGGEGWDKLAPFLGVKMPEVPFPWLNRQ